MDFKPLDKSLPFDGYDAIDSACLETFAYEFPHRKIYIEISTIEFTAVCPYSGLPDFGTISICYTPKEKCIELRSLKYYLLSYRNVGIFYEHLVNRVLEDLVKVSTPHYMKVRVEYTPRGGLATNAEAVFNEN